MDRSDPRVCAIIVCYRPEPVRLRALVQACLSQSATIVLVNNGESFALDLGANANGRIHWIEPGDNLGLAGAQNLGVRWAAAHDFDYLIFFDQDSVPRPRLITSLRCAFEEEESNGRQVGAVGPRLVDPRVGTESSFVRFHVWGVERVSASSDLGAVECDFLISSGMLTSVRRFMAVGPWEDGLFIDNVDMEWCFRARHLGYRCLGVSSARLDHVIGDEVSRFEWFGHSWTVYRHSPARQYFMMRNRIALYKRVYIPLGWKLQDIPRAMFKIFYFGIVAGARSEYLRCLMKGLIDGWRGRLGGLAAMDGKPAKEANSKSIQN